jgi:hypothetical protein
MTTFQKMLAMHILEATPPPRPEYREPWVTYALFLAVAFTIGYSVGVM